MATIKPTYTDVSERGDESAWSVVWTPVTENDTVVAAALPKHADKSVIVTGTFGGATVTFQGSNDGTNFTGLADITGTAISITSAGAKAVAENTWQFKPAFSGGSSQSLTVAVLAVSPNPMRQ